MNELENTTNTAQQASIQAWSQESSRLTQWTLERLVNRTDIYRIYRPMSHRQDDLCNSLTLPWKEREQIPGTLTSTIIEKHYQDSSHSNLIGLYAISAECTCKWFMIDIDQVRCNWLVSTKIAAIAWWEDLRGQGFRPLLLETNGISNGSYHLLVCLSEAISSQRLHAFVSRMVKDFGKYGLRQIPSVCPNDPEINEYRPDGSWWRLPGRHHTREFWTRVWDGSRWLENQEAIEAILGVSGDSPDLIPCDNDSSVSTGQGQGSTAQFARFLLAEGFEPIDVEDFAVRWDSTQNQPPRNEADIREIVRDLVQ